MALICESFNEVMAFTANVYNFSRLIYFHCGHHNFFLRLTFLRLTVKICLLLHLAAKLLAVLQLTVKPIKTFVQGEEELC